MIVFELKDDGLHKRLESLTTAMGNMSSVMESIGDTLVNNVQACFMDQSEPWGTGWKPLAASTKARRRKGKGGGSDRILRDTGHLMNGISYTAGKDSVIIGPNVPYAGTHQFGAAKGSFGTFAVRIAEHMRRVAGKKRKKIKVSAYVRRVKVPWGTVPARPFMPIRGGAVDLPLEWHDEIVLTLETYLRKALEN